MADCSTPADDFGDFDHLDPQWIANPFQAWKKMRDCPIAHTARYGGVYCPTSYAQIREIAYDTEHFSSRRVVVRATPAPPISNAPINSDPPDHTQHRKPLVPAFWPKAVARLEPLTRGISEDLVGRIGARQHCDGAVDFAQHVPARVIAHLVGLPETDADLFRRWIRETLDEGLTDEATSLAAWGELTQYVEEKIDDWTEAPEGSLLRDLMQSHEHDRDYVVGVIRLMVIAGIDTTWSMLGLILLHLAEHPEDRRRLAADRSLLGPAIEEFLRAYAPVTMAREIVADREIDGVTLKAGQMVLLPFGAANRDPKVFPEPDRVIIDRPTNAHAAFGLGRHRCIGASLARMELRIALETWLARYPDFRRDPDRPVTWSRGSVRGPRSVPLILRG